MEKQKLYKSYAEAQAEADRINQKNDVSALEIIGACILGGVISALVLTVYFYAKGFL